MALILTLITSGIFGQTEKTIYKIVADNFENEYNQSNYDSIFAMFSIEMQNALPINKAKEFFTGLENQAGKITHREPAQGDLIILGSRQSNKLINSLKVPQNADLKTDQSFRILTIMQNNPTVTIIEGKDRVGTPAPQDMHKSRAKLVRNCIPHLLTADMLSASCYSHT